MFRRFIFPFAISTLSICVDAPFDLLTKYDPFASCSNIFIIAFVMGIGGALTALSDVLDDGEGSVGQSWKVLRQSPSFSVRAGTKLILFCLHLHSFFVCLFVGTRQNYIPGTVLFGTYVYGWVVRDKAKLQALKKEESMVILFAMIPFWTLIGGQIRLHPTEFGLPLFFVVLSSFVWLQILQHKYAFFASLTWSGIFRLLPVYIVSSILGVPASILLPGLLCGIADITFYQIVKSAKNTNLFQFLYNNSMIICGFFWCSAYLTVAFHCAFAETPKCNIPYPFFWHVHNLVWEFKFSFQRGQLSSRLQAISLFWFLCDMTMTLAVFPIQDMLHWTSLVCFFFWIVVATILPGHVLKYFSFFVAIVLVQYSFARRDYLSFGVPLMCCLGNLTATWRSFVRVAEEKTTQIFSLVIVSTMIHSMIIMYILIIK